MSANIVYQKCIDKGLTIAFAESMTGGGACYEMVQIPGASKVVLGGMIVYQNEFKNTWLKIDKNIIDQYGVVSDYVARKMASSIRDLTHADIGIGITGNAGPTMQDERAGLSAFISIFFKETFYDMQMIFEDLTREEALQLTIQSLYEKLAEIL